MSKHTLGPLKVGKPWGDMQWIPVLTKTGGRIVARLAVCETAVSDANLFAAASEMLKVLKCELRERTGTVTGECEVCGGSSDGIPYHAYCCAETRAVITKAEKGEK